MKWTKRQRVPSPASAARPAAVISPESFRRRRGYHVVAPLALCLLAMLAFSNSFTAGFTLDSRSLLLADPRIQKASLQNLKLIWNHTYWWPTGEAALYRPFTTLSYLVNYSILGNANNPAGYHVINLLLHAAAMLLVFALARRLLAGRAHALLLAFLIAALWGVHPVLTESVTNIAGRADLIAAVAVLSGFLMYLKTVETRGWRSVAWLVGLAASATVAMFSKESAVVLPGIIVLYELVCRDWRSKDRSKKITACAAVLFPLAGMLWQRALVLSASPAAELPFVDNPVVGASFWTARLTAIKVLARYLALAIWPVRLSSDYSFSEIPLASGTRNDWIAWVAVAAFVALVVFLYYGQRLAFFFFCFAFLNLLPAANLLFPIGTIMAERLLYLPLVGFIAGAVIAIDAAATRFRVPGTASIAVACLIMTGFVVRTWLRNLDWKDDLTMALASVETSPGSFKVHRLLAAALFEADPARAHIDQVVAEADRSIAILGSLPDELDLPAPWNLAAACHLAKGDNTLAAAGQRREYEEAVTIASRSIAIEAAARSLYNRRHATEMTVTPAAAEAYRLLASSYLRLQRPEQALAPAVKAQAIHPASVEVYTEIADAYLAQGLGEESAIALAEGMFRTGDSSLRSDLLKLYQSGVDKERCAVVSGPRGPALNPSCEIVHRDLCAGTSRAGRQDLRDQLHCQN